MFNLNKYKKIITAGRKRIKDRGINWKEAYRERSDDLKRRFEKSLGLNSYYRWEGHDYSTDGDYFVVVGPALTREGKKMFFAGIKRLPPQWSEKKIYAPSGAYFSTIMGALSHASNKWGIPFPKNQPRYGQEDLARIKIPRHVKG